MYRLILLFIAFVGIAFGTINPYEKLLDNEKISLFCQYFIDKQIQAQLPPKPKKDKIKDEEITLKPIKYEPYYNYIKRLKAIKKSLAQEQKKINEKYAGDVAFYNGKIKKLQQNFQQKQFFDPIVKEALNKAFFVVYGKPKIKNLHYDKLTNKLTAIFYVDDIYHICKFLEQKILIYINPTKVEDFLQNYSNSTVVVNLQRKDNYLTYDDISIFYKDDEYIATFLTKLDKKIKLNITLNNKLFETIQINKDITK